MYQFLDEEDMWSLVEKNPKETGVLEKHYRKNNKNHIFCNQNCKYIVGYMIHLNKNKTK
jgi:hypothetical protein